MVIAFIITLVLTLILYVLSKGKYQELLSGVDKNIYKTKELMPVSLFVLDGVRRKYNTDYEKSLEIKLEELYGIDRGKYHLKLYLAEKISLLILVLILSLFFGLLIQPVDSTFYFLMITALILVFYLPDRELAQKVKKRRTQMQIDFPEFLNKLALLVNAGMTVTGAMSRITGDRVEFSRERPFYKELAVTMHEIKTGRPEVKAYEDFAKRCRLPEITRFISILIQNLKKGNSELVSILRLQSEECWHMRKTVAKILGEEADTKLLFPMMLMFIAILIIVIAPSVMQLQGM